MASGRKLCGGGGEVRRRFALSTSYMRVEGRKKGLKKLWHEVLWKGGDWACAKDPYYTI